MPLLRRDKHRELRQSDGERVDVAGRLAARAFEDRGAAQLADHVVRLLDSERRDAESDIAQYLDKDAAEAEHDDGAEHRVVLHAEDHLDAALDHRRQQDAVDLGARRPRRDALHDLIEGGAGLARRHVEHDAAHLRLMRDVGRDDLQDEALADFDCGRGGLTGIRDETFVEDRHASLGENALRLVLGDAALRQRRQVLRHGRHGQGRRRNALGAAHRAGDRCNRRPWVLEQPDPGCLIATLHLG